MTGINSKPGIAVYGSYGHTGKFIVERLCEQGYTPILVGRSKDKLSELGIQFSSLKTIVADINDEVSLDNAFADANIIVNAAGPYLDTAEPIIKSALRSGCHYIDLSAEQKAVLDIFENFDYEAKQLGVILLPAAAFYGGLGDLLSTHLTQDWDNIDSIKIYIGLDSWHPTKGTRLTGQRNHYQRFILADGELQPVQSVSSSMVWTFPSPIDSQEMIAVPFSEIITISKHLKVKSINTFISLNSIQDIRNTETPEPVSADKKNRSLQHFCMEIVATKGHKKRSIKAQGQDIYAVTAPIVAEAINRIIKGSIKIKGVTTLGELFDSKDFLNTLNSDDITISKIEESESIEHTH